MFRGGGGINSLAPRRSERNFREVIFKLILVIDGRGISCEIVVTWTPQVLTDEKSTLVQVTAWCRQATSHYLSQCWPSFLVPYGFTRPQWVKGTFTIFPTAFQLLHKFMPSFITFFSHSYLTSKISMPLYDFENENEKKIDSVTPTPEFLQDKQHAKKPVNSLRPSDAYMCR